ncbi:amino acid/polyamine transporter I [Blastocladiella britannica]|nr:amino acid/polyamine transporter I [Blastocladiella britannica]
MQFNTRSLFAVKSVETLQSEASNSAMKRSLGALDLLLLGIGDIIGTGIFVITGNVAATMAGPAVALSFVLAGIACAFAGLCYAELASMLPVSGSAYVYVYASSGELLGWIVGFNLILEYLLGSALAAQGFSAYLAKLLKTFHVVMPHAWTSTPFTWSSDAGFQLAQDTYINLPALLIVIFVSLVLTFGAKETAMFNHFFASIKIVVIVLFLFATFGQVDTARWTPFIPGPSHGHEYGIMGVLEASSMVFIAFIGFDAVSSAAQEVKRPSRDLPIGILGSLVICTILYCLVCMNLTGIADYWTLTSGAPLADAVLSVGMNWLAVCVSVGAVAGLTSVITVSLMALPRIFYTIARDGLIPPAFAKLHPKYRTPYVAIWVNCVVCGSIAAFVPIEVIAHMTSAGTLLAFAMVSASVGVLRIKRPDVERKFKVAGGPYLVPVLGTVICLAMIGLSGLTNMIRLVIWVLLGVVIYMAYGRTHSLVNNPERVLDLPEWEKEEKSEVKMAQLSA